MPKPPPVSPEEQWHQVLVEGHRPLLVLHWLFQLLPGTRRCKVCHNPFDGWSGKLVGLFGFRPSRMNPYVCAT
jgi:adenylate cyclase